MKDIHRETRSTPQNVRCLRWAKNIFTVTCPKSINSAPSHLSYFNINISFGVVWPGTSMSLTLDSFFNV
jgi:hypothetical protein